MCLGIPMQVIEANGLCARCDDRGTPAMVDLALVGEVARSDWLLVFTGAAREVLDAARAREILDAIAALEATLDGSYDPSVFFADLDREPQLPEHLRKPI